VAEIRTFPRELSPLYVLLSLAQRGLEPSEGFWVWGRCVMGWGIGVVCVAGAFWGGEVGEGGGKWEVGRNGIRGKVGIPPYACGVE